MSDRFSITQRCCSWLEKVVFDRVWNEPYAEFRTNTRPRILNGMAEVSIGFSQDGEELTRKIYTPSAGVLTGNFEQIELPHTGTSFYVYAVDVGLFDTIKLRSDKWTSLAEYSDKRLLDLQIYSDSGKVLYRGGSYVRQSDHADMVLLAVDAMALHTSCDYYEDDGSENPVLVRYDPSAIYLTKYFESDWDPDNQIYSKQVSSSQVSNIRVHRTDPVPDDATIAFYNGGVLSGRYINLFKIGGYLEYIKDADVVSNIVLDRKSETLPKYTNNQGKQRVLVHIPLADNVNKRLITFNTCDVYLIPQEMTRIQALALVQKETSGVYVHQCERGENFHQLTFNDFSIDLDLLDKIAEQSGFANNAYYIKVIVRHHCKKLGLTRDANYCDLLYSYKHNDDDIISFLTGESPYIEEYGLQCWTAANLEENSAYAREMVSRLGAAIPEEFREGRYRHVTEKVYIEGKQYYRLDSVGEYKEVVPAPGAPIDEGVYEYDNVHSYPPISTEANTKVASGSFEYRNYDATKITCENQCKICGVRDICTMKEITDKYCPQFTVRKIGDYIKIFGFFQTLAFICWRVSQFKVLKDVRRRIVGFVPKHDYTKVTETKVVEAGEKYFVKRVTEPRYYPFRESTTSKAVTLWHATGTPALREVLFEKVDLSNLVYQYAYRDDASGSLVLIKDIGTVLDASKTYYIVSFNSYEEIVVPQGTVLDPNEAYFTQIATAASNEYYAQLTVEPGYEVRADGTVWNEGELKFANDEVFTGVATDEGIPIYASENLIVHSRVPLVLSDRSYTEFDVLVYVNGLKVNSEVVGDCYAGTDGLLEVYHSYVPRLADNSFCQEFQRRLCVKIIDDIEIKAGDFITTEVVVKTDDDYAHFRQKFNVTETVDRDEGDIHDYAFSMPCERNDIKTFDHNAEVRAINGTATEYIFLNRRLLVPNIDYLPYTQFTKNSRKEVPVSMQNVSYIVTEEDNLLEAITSTDQRIGTFTGYLKGKWIEWQGVAPFWYDNLSVLSVDGRVCANFENKYSGIEIKDETMENGKPYYIRTVAPVAALYAMNANDEMLADATTMKHIADYFNSFYTNDKYRMVIPCEHKVFSRYLHTIIKYMLSTNRSEATRRSGGYTPGTTDTPFPQLGYFDFDLPITREEFLDKVAQFDSIKSQDVVFAESSAVDLRYVDVYPTFHNLDIGSREMRRKIAFMISMLTPTDNMRHREHIDGNDNAN